MRFCVLDGGVGVKCIVGVKGVYRLVVVLFGGIRDVGVVNMEASSPPFTPVVVAAVSTLISGPA